VRLPVQQGAIFLQETQEAQARDQAQEGSIEVAVQPKKQKEYRANRPYIPLIAAWGKTTIYIMKKEGFRWPTT
jgi:hypothetical protein